MQDRSKRSSGRSLCRDDPFEFSKLWPAKSRAQKLPWSIEIAVGATERVLSTLCLLRDCWEWDPEDIEARNSSVPHLCGFRGHYGRYCRRNVSIEHAHERHLCILAQLNIRRARRHDRLLNSATE